MRSRYTAFVEHDADHLLRSWHPDTRPATVTIDPEARWLGLKVKRTVDGRRDDRSGEVEFVARFKIAGKAHRLHELSRFARVGGEWLYVDGDRIAHEPGR